MNWHWCVSNWPNILVTGRWSNQVFLLYFVSYRQRVNILSQVCKQTIAKVIVSKTYFLTREFKLIQSESDDGREMHILSHLSWCFVVQSQASDSYSGSTVKVHRCHYSYIYILCPLRFVIANYAEWLSDILFFLILTLFAKNKINLVLNMRDGCAGEYWPKAVEAQTESSKILAFCTWEHTEF